MMKNEYSPALSPVGYSRWWDWPAALLFIAAILTATTRLASTHWTEQLSLIGGVAFLGVLAGLALGQSRFPVALARLFALVYGLFVIPWRIGLTLGEGVEWQERLVSMGNRLLVTIDQITQQQPVSDNLFFLFLMATLFWALAVYGGFSLTRHGNAWRAILPVGLALVVIHAYDPFFTVRGWYLAAYIFFALLLVARLHFLELYSRWKGNHSYLPPYLGLDFVRTALVVAGMLVLLAWTAPALASALPPAEEAWLSISRPWLRLRDRLSNAFSSLQASVGFVSDFYGDTLSLGRGNPLTDAVVLTVQAPPRIASGVRYYWRTRVYDHYDSQWNSTLPATRALTPDEFDLAYSEYEGRSTSRFTIKTFYPIQDLYTPAQPTWVSRPVNAQLAINPDATVDLGLLEADPYLRAGEVYEVEASLSSATKKLLRAAGTDYPSWVTNRYLQLPDNITPETHKLAKDITAGLENPYDQVEEITNYLRNNITYKEVIPLPPSGKEPIDWLLFDSKEGFCNYYATAEVVLLRSLGIPARLAVGYSQGERKPLEDINTAPTLSAGGENIPQEFQELGDLYTVRHRDAHAWPEVYFPSVGWVEFEPTAAQSPIIRAEDESQLLAGEDSGQGGESSDPRDQGRRPEDEIPNPGDPDASALGTIGLRIPAIYWGLITAVSVALVTIVVQRVRRQRGSLPVPVQLEAGIRRIGLEPPGLLSRWAYYASLSPLVHAYQEINQALSRLRARPKLTDTPAERATNLRRLLPVADAPIQTLLAEYHTTTYGSKPGNTLTAQRAGREIRNFSFLARFKRFLARYQEPARNTRQLYK